jgi:pyrroloquinoline quinone (PQQ) biosynthesis protein C
MYWSYPHGDVRMHHHLHAHVDHATMYHAMIVVYAKDYVLLTSSFRFRFSLSRVYFKCSKEIAMRERRQRG